MTSCCWFDIDIYFTLIRSPYVMALSPERPKARPKFTTTPLSETTSIPAPAYIIGKFPAPRRGSQLLIAVLFSPALTMKLVDFLFCYIKLSKDGLQLILLHAWRKPSHQSGSSRNKTYCIRKFHVLSQILSPFC